jgi:RNA polymerase sigma factor (sigma-70 family)
MTEDVPSDVDEDLDLMVLNPGPRNAAVSDISYEFAQMIRDHGPRMLAQLYRAFDDYQFAEDVVNEALFRMHAVWYRVEAGLIKDPCAYASQVAYHVASRELARQARQRELMSQEGSAGPWWEPSCPRLTETEVENRICVHDLLRELVAVAPRQAQAVVLRHLEDKTFKDVAEEMGIDADSAKSTAHQGVEHLKRIAAKMHGVVGTPKGGMT